jgi:uncharacterized RDD family membrane protein YckC
LNAVDIVAKYNHNFVFRRIGAYLIDLFLFLGMVLGADSLLGNDLYQKLWFVWWLIIPGVHIVCEGLFGQSIGKLVFRIKIVNEDLSNPGVMKSLARNLMKLLEANPLIFAAAIAGILALATRNKQRLGDMVTNTYIIDKREFVLLDRELSAMD